MKRRPVGRPAIWHKSIVEFVEKRGVVRARELRLELGIPRQSLYRALDSLVCAGSLSWHASDHGNYRLISKATAGADIVPCPGI